jgi:hypothetical protein
MRFPWHQQVAALRVAVFVVASVVATCAGAQSTDYSSSLLHWLRRTDIPVLMWSDEHVLAGSRWCAYRVGDELVLNASYWCARMVVQNGTVRYAAEGSPELQMLLEPEGRTGIGRRAERIRSQRIYLDASIPGGTYVWWQDSWGLMATSVFKLFDGVEYLFNVSTSAPRANGRPGRVDFGLWWVEPHLQVSHVDDRGAYSFLTRGDANWVAVQHFDDSSFLVAASADEALLCRSEQRFDWVNSVSQVRLFWREWLLVDGGTSPLQNPRRVCSRNDCCAEYVIGSVGWVVCQPALTLSSHQELVPCMSSPRPSGPERTTVTQPAASPPR